MKIGFNFSILIITLFMMVITSCNDEANVFVNGISLNSADSVQIAVDSTLTLTATVSPVSATNKDIIWSTSNAGVAIVNGGVIKGILPGTAKVVATTADGAMSASVVVTVAVEVNSVALNESTLDIRIGEKGSFTYTVLPATATNKEVTWSSNDTTVAKVDPATGEITGVSEGKATITATSKDGEFTDMSEVTIVNPYGKEPMLALQTGDRFEMVRVFENNYVERFINYEFEVIPSFTAVNPWNAPITFENDRTVLNSLIEGAKDKGYYFETRKAPNADEVYQGVMSHLDGVLPPSDAYVISNTTLKAGSNTAKVTYTIDKSKLYPGVNIIPVKLKGVGTPFKVDPDSPVGYILVQYVPDRSNVPIKSSSSHQSLNYSPKRVAGLFDSDFNTSWRPGAGSTSFPNGISNDNNPAIVVDLGAETDVSAVELWTRGPGERQGSLTETYRVSPPYITNVKVYVSSDNQCWEAANGEFLLQGTTLIKTEKPYWGAPVIDYNWQTNNPNSRPCTLTFAAPKRGRYVIFWFTKSGNQMDLWELFVYGYRK
ncbi:MAG: Ig-like domain-containing protein [Proteiniphilum sp.]